MPGRRIKFYTLVGKKRKFWDRHYLRLAGWEQAISLLLEELVKGRRIGI